MKEAMSGGNALLSMFADHERVVGELYVACATVDDECEELFSALAADEKRHESLLKELQDRLDRDNVVLEIPKIEDKKILLRNSINFVRRQMDQVRKGGGSRDQFLEMAHVIEKSMFERGFLSFIKPLDEDMRKVLKTLADETKKHRDLIWARQRRL